MNCKDCYWESAETCRICKQEETGRAVGLPDAVKDASEKGLITTYLAERWEYIPRATRA